MKVRGFAALALALGLVAACAPQPAPPARVVAPTPPPPALTDLYVLLPSETGETGALVVTHGAFQTTLAAPYEAARIEQAGTLETATVAPDSVTEPFGAALRAQPPRPASFVLYFLPGTDEVTAESTGVVEQILRDIARRPAPDVVVIGHTDTVGTDDFNDQLSLQRAERVRTALIRQGLSATRIQATGRGRRELLVPTGDQVSEPRNRRVEIVVR